MDAFCTIGCALGWICPFALFSSLYDSFLDGLQGLQGTRFDGNCGFQGWSCHLHWALPGIPQNTPFLLVLQ